MKCLAQVQELRALLRKATPRPWVQASMVIPHRDPYKSEILEDATGDLIKGVADCGFDSSNPVADAALIVAAINHLEDLLNMAEEVLKPSYCCAEMRQHMDVTCPTHSDPFDCCDNLFYRRKDDSIGIIVRDGGTSTIRINYCPFCGADR